MITFEKRSNYFLMMVILLSPGLSAAAENPLSHSLNWAVLFLMAMPYTIGATVLAWVLISRRRGAKNRNDQLRRRGLLHLIETPKEGGR